MKRIDDIPKMKAKVLTIMATRSQDQHLVSDVANQFGLPGGETKGTATKVIPAFGWHPWFSHHIYNDTENHTGKIDKLTHYKSVLTGTIEDASFIEGFPDPRPLSDLISATRAYLEQHPGAMVGEIGLDRSFRVPENFSPADRLDADSELTPGGREGRRLTPHRVDLDHQKALLRAQLRLAGELSRAVSVHGVAAHGALFDTLQETWRGHERAVVSKRLRKRRASAANAHENDGKDPSPAKSAAGSKPYPPRICLHSYSGPPETVRQYLSPAVPAEIFFSFSRVINFSTSAVDKAREVIRILPDERILVESDLHCAGERMDRLLEEMVREVCELKGWGLEEGVRVLGRNWHRFAFGKDEA